MAPFTELKPVKKFTDRKAAVARIWAAVQRLSPDGAQPAADVAPAKAKAKKAPAKAPRRARAQKGTDVGSNKKAEVIAMMKCAKGATLAEIVEATGWQKHTVRGFVSIVGSKGGEKIESSKNTAGERMFESRSSNQSRSPRTPLPVPAGAAFSALSARFRRPAQAGP